MVQGAWQAEVLLSVTNRGQSLASGTRANCFTCHNFLLSGRAWISSSLQISAQVNNVWLFIYAPARPRPSNNRPVWRFRQSTVVILFSDGVMSIGAFTPSMFIGTVFVLISCGQVSTMPFEPDNRTKMAENYSAFLWKYCGDRCWHLMLTFSFMSSYLVFKPEKVNNSKDQRQIHHD